MLKRKPLFFVLMMALYLPIFSRAQTTPLPKSDHQFVVIAHRGDHSKAPENTLAAYQNAIDNGADFVEIDLRQTKDSQLIIMHNDNIKAMTGYDGEVKDMLFDSIRNKKVRNVSHPEWGLQTIPTFKEVLQLCKGKINIYLDFKEAPVAETFKQILAAGMQEHVIVYINQPHQFAEWGTIAPMMPLMISLPRSIQTKEEMNQLLVTFDIDILDGAYKEYNAETVAAAKAKQIPIWADIQSQNEGAVQWEAALKLGLQGLQTDHVKELVNFLIQKGVR